MQWNDDGKIEINGLIFHRSNWNEKPKVLDNPLGGLTYIKKKTDLAKRFRRFFMDYKYPKMDEHKEDLNYEEERKLSTDFLLGLGFVSKEISNYPYYSWTHKLKLDDLKDLFIQTFSNDLKEDLEKYAANETERLQYREDMDNREILAKGIEEYIGFKAAFSVRKTAMRELIEDVELSIGKGYYRRLATYRDGHGNYQYIPEKNRENAFEAMAYAKEWLRTFEPVMEELDRLDDSLNFPWELSRCYNRIPEEKLREISLRKLADFRYQDFLTFLMDFKLRFGKDDGEYNRDSRILSGWTIAMHHYDGEYEHGGDAAKWDVFNCGSLLQHSRYGQTWRQWLENKALSGEIEALADPQTLQDIVMSTNHSRHRHNQKYKLYEKPLILVTKGEVKKEAQE